MSRKSTLATIFKQELDEKKVMNAFRDTQCDNCQRAIEMDDEFIFMGSAQKICTVCQGEMSEFLEELENQK